MKKTGKEEKKTMLHLYQGLCIFLMSVHAHKISSPSLWCIKLSQCHSSKDDLRRNGGLTSAQRQREEVSVLLPSLPQHGHSVKNPMFIKGRAGSDLRGPWWRRSGLLTPQRQEPFWAKHCHQDNTCYQDDTDYSSRLWHSHMKDAYLTFIAEVCDLLPGLLILYFCKLSLRKQTYTDLIT